MTKRKEQPLNLWLREAAGNMLRLAEDLDRDTYESEPQAETYDLECACREAIDYVRNYRTEAETQDLANEECTYDENGSLMLGKNQVL